MATRRPKQIVMKCRCGCGRWAGFTDRPKFNSEGRANRLGMYAETHGEAVRNAIRWSTNHTDGGASDA